MSKGINSVKFPMDRVVNLGIKTAGTFVEVSFKDEDRLKILELKPKDAIKLASSLRRAAEEIENEFIS